MKAGKHRIYDNKTWHLFPLSRIVHAGVYSRIVSYNVNNRLRMAYSWVYLYATTVGIICLHDLTSFLVTQIVMNWCIENRTNFCEKLVIKSMRRGKTFLQWVSLLDSYLRYFVSCPFYEWSLVKSCFTVKPVFSQFFLSNDMKKNWIMSQLFWRIEHSTEAAAAAVVADADADAATAANDGNWSGGSNYLTILWSHCTVLCTLMAATVAHLV